MGIGNSYTIGTVEANATASLPLMGIGNWAEGGYQHGHHASLITPHGDRKPAAQKNMGP